MKKQNILILEKSAVQNNIQESDQSKMNQYKDEVGGFVPNKEHQTTQEKIFLPVEKCFNLRNPYFELCLKPNETVKSSDNSNSIRCKEGKQSVPLRINKNQSIFFARMNELELSDVIENQTINIGEGGNKPIEINQLETLQLVKSSAPKKRGHDDDSSMREWKKIPSKSESDLAMGSPYAEFILRSENSHLCVSESTSGREKTIDGNKNGTDIFGNRLTSKDQNKLKVICPHCTKKVSAPGFVRHLSYCMRVQIRKSIRRS